jgi:hypothetical protein
MDCLEGLESTPDECVLLKKAIYGLVQSTRQFFKKLIQVLKSVGFKGSSANPCLMMMQCNKGIIFIACHVDNCSCCGHEEAINKSIEQVKRSGFILKVLYSKDKQKAWLGQPHLIHRVLKRV